MGNANDMTHILLVSPQESDYQWIHTMLHQMRTPYQLQYASRLEAGRVQMRSEPVDIVLCEQTLAGANYQELRQVTQTPDSPPILLIVDTPLSPTDMDAIHAGAVDVLVREEITQDLLERTLQVAIQRHHILNDFRSREARYRDVVDGQQELLIRFDTNFALTFVNRAYCEYRGQSSDELLGTNALITVAAEDCSALLDSIEGLNDPSQPAANEVRTSDYDAEYWHHWATRVITDAQGQPIEYQSMIRNITERKTIQQELNTRLNELRTLRRVDAELTDSLNIVSVSTLALDSAMRLSGADIAVLSLYNEETEALEVNMAYGVEPGAVAETYREKYGVIGQIMVDHQPLYIPDMQAEEGCRPTTPKMISQMIIPLLSQDSLLGMISLETRLPERFNEEVFEFLQLVTARIAVALDNARLYDLQRTQLEELQKLYAQVTQLEQLKTDMIRIASHDLRNPIGVMQGYVEILQWDIQADAYDAMKFTEHLRAMEKMTRRMRKITSDILSVDRIEQSGQKDRTDPIDFTQILSEVCEEHSFLAAGKSQMYRIYLPDMPTYIYGDHAQLREAAANLISNAIKYTPDNGRVIVSLEYDGDAAIFEVQDTGYGIPIDLQKRLFEPFYRAKTKETAAIEGTGLGLHLVKNIVERHHGRMIFRSRYKEGSTFGFQIPTNPSTES
jgi:PAS domain S-box-containing protein